MVEIRDMAPEDVDRIVELEKEIFVDAWEACDFENSFEVDDMVFLVAESDGEIVGYCGMWVIVDNCEILNIAVSDRYRGRGIGESMLRQMIDTGRERGAVTFTLEVREGNDPARNLYDKYGFRIVGRRKAYYNHPREDAILMTKREETDGC